jgi:uncharacterized protein with HEPN domain
MSTKGNLFHLVHIRENCQLAIDCVNSLSEDEFYRHSMAKYACIRFLEVIGEASKNLTEDLRTEYPELNWRAAIGMRDRLAHDYAGTDFTIVWDTVTQVLPDFLKQIEAIIAALRT